MPQTAEKQKQTEINSKQPDVKNVDLLDVMFPFKGAWLPSVDPILIGPTNFQDLTNMRYTEGGIEGINGYFDFNSTAIATYTNINTGLHFRTNRTDDSYLLVHAADDSGNGRVLYSTSNIGSAEGTGTFNATALHTDASADLVGRFSNGPSGALAYCNQEESLLWEGKEADIMTLFTTALADPDAAAAYPIDKTKECLNRIISDYIELDTSARFTIMILSTSPIQGIKLYVDPSNPNTNVVNTNALDVEYWNGSIFTNVSSLVDGTTKLTETGTLSFDSTIDVAKTKHYAERYAYAYKISMTASSGTSAANIYQVTVDKPMQPPTNIWDGIYRQPIQVQRYTATNTVYDDYTVHVREASTVDLPVGLLLGQLLATGHILLMFEEPMAAVKFTMLGSLVNILAAKLDTTAGVQYWDGDSWANLSFTDETLDAAADSSFSKTGLVYWTPPEDDEQQELFGTLGYAYRFTTDGTLTGSSHNDVVADFVTGIPAQQEIERYRFPAQYKNKIMMCGYVEGNEGNRIDFCKDNNPHMWNGVDSSDNGFQSIYVGSVEEITAATQLYNRFGSNIFSIFVILKDNEVWLMTGSSPQEYRLFPISFRVGCPAPGTLTTAEVGFEVGEKVERNVAMWLSHQGPVMFDGAVIHPVVGIEKYFDPNESGSVNFSYFKESQSWFDATNNEWNILIPTDSSTVLNKWLVYDVRRKKWFEKDVNLNASITCGIQSVATDGDQYIYGGSADGRVYELETGPSWDGNKITYSVTTGDVFPTKNEWDETLIRRLKLVAKRLEETPAEVEIFYNANTDSTGGVAVRWVNTTATLTNSGTAGVSFVTVTASMANSGDAGVDFPLVPVEVLDMASGSGLNRVVRVNKDMNEIGWSHAFKFSFTSDESNKGFQPLMWGIQFQKVRLEQR